MTSESSAESTFVLTLEFDPTSFERLNALRKLHFPRSRNFIPAHLTLLHTVSRDQAARLLAERHRYAEVASIVLNYTELKFLGRGVAISIDAPTLGALRTDVMSTVDGPFTPQDRQPFRPHVTIQNKVDPSTARVLFDELKPDFVPWIGAGEGLLLWRYLDGPWALEDRLRFRES